MNELPLTSAARLGSDPDTGAAVLRWTESEAKDQHLYFTSPSVTSDDRWLVILSERTGDPNLFAIDRATGEAQQVSRNTGGLRRAYVYPKGTETGLSKASPCLNAETGTLIWIEADRLMAADVAERAPRVVCDLPAGWLTAFTHIDHDGRRACVPVAEGEAFEYPAEGQGDQMAAAVERFAHDGLVSRILVIDLQTGRIEQEAEVPFWVTHVQFSPTDPTRLIFNQEGNSGRYISQRIWKWDLDRDHVLPLHPQLSYEWLAHESFSPDGGCIVSHGGRRDGSERWVERRAWSGKLVQRIAAGGSAATPFPAPTAGRPCSTRSPARSGRGTSKATPRRCFAATTPATRARTYTRIR